MSERKDDADAPVPDAAHDRSPGRRGVSWRRRWLPFCVVAATLGVALIPGALSDVQHAGVVQALLPMLVITWALGALAER
jgi:hypothetical protein